MTDLEARLRRDLRNVAERAGPDSIRPLVPPELRSRSRAARWLAPAAAMIAVGGVIAGVSLAGANDQGSMSPAPNVTGETTFGMPGYYVIVFQRYTDGGSKITTTAAVHDSATGATLATVPVPTLMSQGGANGPGITAAADDRTFVITETGGAGPKHNLFRFYRLRVAANGRSVSLTRLHISVPGSLGGDTAAVSPDGTRLAMQEQSCYSGGCRYTGIRVITIATGAVRTWTARVTGAAPFEVSWAGNSTVAFQWQNGYRLLNVAGAGGNLLAGPVMPSSPAEPTGYIPNALVTQDRRIVITSTVRNIPDADGTDTVVAKIIELSARTGKLLRVLSTTTVHGVTAGNSGDVGNLDQNCNVLSVAPKGVNALVECFSVGRIDGSAFTPLAGFPSPSSSGISGQIATAW